jgi:predicted transcriptional regulator
MKKRTGRPVKKPEPGKRMSLGLKVTAEIKERIDKAAKASGRTQSQEAEALIERAIAEEGFLAHALGGVEIRDIAIMMGLAFASGARGCARSGGHEEWTAKEWMKDKDCYLVAMVSTIKALVLHYPGIGPEDFWMVLEAVKGRVMTEFANPVFVGGKSQ